MNKPTGKLAFAYATIIKLEARIAELEASNAGEREDDVQKIMTLATKYGNALACSAADTKPLKANLESAIRAALASKPPADNWQQYAKEGETAQACIERHRSEQDGLMNLLKEARSKPPAGEQKPVAYLDIGAGGYVDLGSDLTPEQLQALPFGRHVLAIVGTFGAEGYSAAAAQPEQVARDKKGGV